ncbi:MAG: hypothetical protein K2Q01_03000, partial [Rickettsiales bacterium]|nr:hypothetical protein [Rickettsiales bacterium]
MHAPSFSPEPPEPNEPADNTAASTRPDFFHQGYPQAEHVKIINTVALVLPLLGFVAALLHGFIWGFNATALGIFAVFYVLTVLGITVGFH